MQICLLAMSADSPAASGAELTLLILITKYQDYDQKLIGLYQKNSNIWF